MLTVRGARPDDAPDIVRINIRAWREAYAGIVPEDVLAAMDEAERIERYRERLSQWSPFENVVAVDAGRTVGYTAFGPYRVGRHEAMLSRRVGEVLAIYVDPSRWGTGAGRTLMDAAVARLAARGFTSVRLWVLTDNAQAEVTISVNEPLREGTTAIIRATSSVVISCARLRLKRGSRCKRASRS